MDKQEIYQKVLQLDKQLEINFIEFSQTIFETEQVQRVNKEINKKFKLLLRKINNKNMKMKINFKATSIH